MRRGTRAAVAVFALVLVVPEAARACSVCGIGPGPSNTAFMISTILLTFVPLIVIGCGVACLWARIRSSMAEDFEERPLPVAPVTPPGPVGSRALAGMRPAEA